MAPREYKLFLPHQVRNDSVVIILRRCIWKIARSIKEYFLVSRLFFFLLFGYTWTEQTNSCVIASNVRTCASVYHSTICYYDNDKLNRKCAKWCHILSVVIHSRGKIFLDKAYVCKAHIHFEYVCFYFFIFCSAKRKSFNCILKKFPCILLPLSWSHLRETHDGARKDWVDTTFSKVIEIKWFCAELCVIQWTCQLRTMLKRGTIPEHNNFWIISSSIVLYLETYISLFEFEPK